jgi:hypothetical protein
MVSTKVAHKKRQTKNSDLLNKSNVSPRWLYAVEMQKKVSSFTLTVEMQRNAIIFYSFTITVEMQRNVIIFYSFAHTVEMQRNAIILYSLTLTVEMQRNAIIFYFLPLLHEYWIIYLT